MWRTSSRLGNIRTLRPIGVQHNIWGFRPRVLPSDLPREKGPTDTQRPALSQNNRSLPTQSRCAAMPAIPSERSTSAGGPTAAVQRAAGLILELEVPPDAALAAVTAFWEFEHAALPTVHRATFENAWLEPSGLYGCRRPVALLHALAASGMRHAELLGVSDGLRLRYAVACWERCKALLLAGWGTPGSPTAIEALQALSHATLFLTVMGVSYEARRPMNEFYRDLAAATCLETEGVGAGVTRRPRDAGEWVELEVLQRLFLMVAWNRAGEWYYCSGRDQKSIEWLCTAVALPAPDTYFEMTSAENAFALLQCGPTPFEPAVVDLTPVVRGSADSAAVSLAVHRTVRPLFEGRASYLGIGYVHSALRHLRGTIRDFAEAHSIDVFSLASTDPGAPTAREAARYLSLVGVADTACEAVLAAMPEHVGDALRQGDPRPLLNPELGCFPDARFGHAFLGLTVAVRAIAIENWFHPNADPPPDFFASAPFAAALESGAAIVRAVGAQAELGGAPHAPAPAFVAALRAGSLALAAAIALRGSHTEAGGALESAFNEARTVRGYLELMAAGSPSLIISAVSLFSGLMARARVPGSPSPPADRLSPRTDVGPRSEFADVVMTLESVMTPMYVEVGSG
ncbi:hypothetical protein DFJ74DRAFT_774490 [Hyaloraphidium curvatum]|nr:hypothetical protein DFJ74DRAFT_774490 [Hyaloraphidium curvatum]